MAVLISALASVVASAREYYELRTYHFQTAEAAGMFDKAMEKVGVAALQEAGAPVIGVFKRKPEQGKEESHERYLLAASPELEGFVEHNEFLVDAIGDNEELKKYLSTPKKDPAFTRIDSTLMVAFKGFPELADPEGDGGGERFFELRVYESHDELKGRLKVEMFNEGGEIKLFKETGLRVVFFGQSIIGPNLPNLTYMLVHENEAEKKKTWDAFKSSPAWDKLKKEERYADTVSKIDAPLLVAMPYSPLK